MKPNIVTVALSAIVLLGLPSCSTTTSSATRQQRPRLRQRKPKPRLNLGRQAALWV